MKRKRWIIIIKNNLQSDLVHKSQWYRLCHHKMKTILIYSWFMMTLFYRVDVIFIQMLCDNHIPEIMFYSTVNRDSLLQIETEWTKTLIKIHFFSGKMQIMSNREYSVYWLDSIFEIKFSISRFLNPVINSREHIHSENFPMHLHEIVSIFLRMRSVKRNNHIFTNLDIQGHCLDLWNKRLIHFPWQQQQWKACNWNYVFFFSI